MYFANICPTLKFPSFQVVHSALLHFCLSIFLIDELLLLFFVALVGINFFLFFADEYGSSVNFWKYLSFLLLPIHIVSSTRMLLFESLYYCLHKLTSLKIWAFEGWFLTHSRHPVGNVTEMFFSFWKKSWQSSCKKIPQLIFAHGRSSDSTVSQ